MTAELPRQTRHLWMIGGLLAGGLVLARVFEKEVLLFMPACPLHAATGLYCPGCGATRATGALLRGEVMAAFHFNALYVLALPFLLWFLGQALLREKPWQGSTRCGLGVMAALIIFGVLRNLPGFEALAPHG